MLQRAKKVTGDVARVRAEPPRGAADGLNRAADTFDDASRNNCFDPQLSTRPEPRIRPSSRRETSGSGQKPEQSGRRFASNSEAEAYGESILGPIRDKLPADELDSAYLYTKTSWVNLIVRHDSPDKQLDQLAQDSRLLEMLVESTGNPWPTMADVVSLARRESIEPAHRSLVDSIMKHPRPSTRFAEIKRNQAALNNLRDNYGTEPTPAVLNAYLTTLDRAVDQKLPEPLQIRRGLKDIEFMVTDRHGTPLGSQDPRNLIDTVQRERGYISGCLGPDLPGEFRGRYRLDLDLPAGAKGLWMGDRSHYPHQRELILPRDLPYRINEAIVSPGGRECVLKGTILPR